MLLSWNLILKVSKEYYREEGFLYEFRSARRLTINDSGALVQIVPNMIYIFLSYCEEVPRHEASTL